MWQLRVDELDEQCIQCSFTAWRQVETIRKIAPPVCLLLKLCRHARVAISYEPSAFAFHNATG
jgi:hypothetical protein